MYLEYVPTQYSLIITLKTIEYSQRIITNHIVSVGAIDPFGNRVPLDSEIAIQERTLTRYGLNLYDGATWEIALALEGITNKENKKKKKKKNKKKNKNKGNKKKKKNNKTKKISN